MPILSLVTEEDTRRQLEEMRSYFPNTQFGTRRDVSRGTYADFVHALGQSSEEAIQQFLTANPYVIQYAIPQSGHHGVWVFPKQMIKTGAAHGTAGLIPDYLVASRSSLGFYWHVVELKRFDVQFANLKGTSLSSAGNKGFVQCNGYLDHFQNYIDAVRTNIQVPDLIQPKGAILIIGNSEHESATQLAVRSMFERTNSKITVASYQRLLQGLAHDVGVA